MAKHTGKNVVIALALAGALVLVVTQRVLPYLAERATYTDGERAFTLGRSEGIRYAIWNEARRLGGAVNSAARESRPAVSPDGRLVVFAVGVPGLNAELWAADLVDGQPRDPHPLAVLNSEADDLAPAFGEGALYFSSNREGGAGGFDLWAATWDGLDFGLPAPVGGGLNTPADELDPAPLGTPGLAHRNGHFGWRERLAFASNRGQRGRGDLDLFLALPGGAEGRVDVIAFPGLNTEFDEREPDFTPAGNTFYFASDRPGGAGGWDLYRSVLERGEWLPPEPVAGLNTAADERGPQAGAGGFELYFSRERVAPAPLELEAEETSEARENDPGDLFRARSSELFRLPRGPQSWLDLLLLGALLLLALLAFLAKRWEQLDILYKCLLVSVLLHLLLMWLLREVYPEAGSYELPETGREATFQVRVLSSRAPAEGLDERGGALELAWEYEQAVPPGPERVELAAQAPVPALAAPAPERFERESRAPETAPARRSLEVARAPAAAPAEPALQDREPDVERIGAGAPALALRVSELRPEPREVERASERPGRLVASATASERALAIAPAVSSVERAAAPLAGPQRFELAAATPLELERPEARGRRGPDLAMPAEEPVVERAAPAPLARLPEPAAVGASRSAAQPAAFEPARVATPARAAGPSAAPSPSLAGVSPDLHRRAPGMPDPGRFRPDPDARPALAAPSLRGPGLAQPADESELQRALAGPAAQLALPGPRALALAPDRAFDLGASVRRRALAAVRPPEEGPRPDQRPLLTARRPETDLPAAPERSDLQPYRSRFGSEKKIAIETFGGGADTEAAVARGLAYLARRQTTRGNWSRAADLHPKYRQVAVGNSGLALLAFLGAGHTHRSGTDYSENVERVIGWLLSVQDDRTGHFGNSSSYSHGIATYALAECFALTGDEQLRRPLERAVAQILRSQIPDTYRGDRRMVGGWSYYYPDGSTYDSWPRVSITSWQVMALESARLGGLIVPEHALELAKAFIIGSWDERLGAVRYSHDPERLNSGYPTLPGSTPAGLFVLSLFGEDIASDRFLAPRNYLLRRMPDGFRFTSEDDFVFRAQGNVYFWYYASLALLRVGGAEWERWNAALKATLLPAQREDGSWRPLDVYAEYAGDTKDDSVYTTAICVLTLEVYYRYFTPLLEAR